MEYVELINRREQETSARSSGTFPQEMKLIDSGLELLLQAFKRLLDAGVADLEEASIQASMHLQGRATSVLIALRRLAALGYWQEVLILERVAWEMIQRIEVYSQDETKAEAYLKDTDYMSPSDLRETIAGEDQEYLKRLRQLYTGLSRFPHGKVIMDASAAELLAPPPDKELRMLLLTVSRLTLKLLSLLSVVYREVCDLGENWKIDRAAWTLLWKQLTSVSNR